MQKHLAWLMASVVLGCGSVGTVESHRIKGSETPPPPPSDDADGGEDSDAAPGPCPSGWTCMDLSAFGTATDGDGQPVTASCSNGAQMACDDADPGASCQGLSKPICAHLEIGGQEIVSCAQRCAP